jgi:2-dehydro-3-deoxygluconokinase
MPKPRVLAIGECMLELSPVGADRQLRLGYGGDTLNTSIYLSRLGVGVSYLTELGNDPHSDHMIAEWQAEGVDTELVLRREGRLPGLYLIDIDARGERSFHYWRREAPVRQLFDDDHAVELVLERAGNFDLVYLSGITLSLFDEAGRDRLCTLLAALRHEKVRIAFDSNYRPAGWQDEDEARAAMGRVIAMADLLLPTFADEQALNKDSDHAGCLARLADAGAQEVALKCGAEGCTLLHDGRTENVDAVAVETVVDTTAAGDAFNAAYLAARLRGESPNSAASAGHRLAAAVIGVRGAIIPAEHMP